MSPSLSDKTLSQGLHPLASTIAQYLVFKRAETKAEAGAPEIGVSDFFSAICRMGRCAPEIILSYTDLAVGSFDSAHSDCAQVRGIFDSARIDPLKVGAGLHSDDRSWMGSETCKERVPLTSKLTPGLREIINQARRNRDIDAETVTPGLLLLHLIEVMPVKLDAILTDAGADRGSLKRVINEKITTGIGNPAYAAAMAELNSLIGLATVKEKVRRRMNVVKTQKIRHRIDPSASTQSLISSHHCVFTGQPGTGKTTVARLMGKIFHALGIISKPEIVERRRSTLIGAHLGQTEAITKAAVEAAEGGILFIDEAHELLEGSDDLYGKAALQELQKQMEDKRDKVVVIFAGYGELLDRVLSYNPGFRSRFPGRNFIHFDDYNPVELAEIFQAMASEKGFLLKTDFVKKLLIHTSLLYDRKNSEFGNAREMRNLLEEVIEEFFDQIQGENFDRVQDRMDDKLLSNRLSFLPGEAFVSEFKSEVEALASGPDAFIVFCLYCGHPNSWFAEPKDRLSNCQECKKPLPPVQFGVYRMGKFYEETRAKLARREDTPPLQRLDGLVGLANVKIYVRQLHDRFRADHERRKAGMYMDPDYSKHLVFTGRPGTGKTTVARLIGQIYREIGFLRKGHVVECRGAELIVGWVGQTAPNAKAFIKRALDGILFIDEAYVLLPSTQFKTDFGGAVINTLLTEMLEHQRRLIVILAGYKDRLDELWKSNAGFRSRFPAKNHIDFVDYTPDELTQIFVAAATKQGFKVDPALEHRLSVYFSVPAVIHADEFANARTAEQKLSEILDQQSQRIVAAKTKMSNEPSTSALSDELFLLREIDFVGAAKMEADHEMS
jgi:SpoVK/Ycf46/Vps4 family AAA+-type ATPase